ncbi:MAG TPA: enoyl-CoA hydratase [Polyangiales bacterium]|nr:enoyl-CoA hydratase [Polyangiales bacterium]
MAEDYEHIAYRQQGSVGIITLNRPERLNAWTTPMEHSVKRAVLAAAGDDSARAIVITGAGRGFCAGADMELLQGASAASATRREAAKPAAVASELDPELSTPYPGRFGYLLSVGKPIIAAINGPCAGIGFVLTLFCDLRWASDQAMFTTAFAKRGLIAEHGSSWLLPRLIGPARALDLMLSARRVQAAEAATIGLVNETFAHATFMDDVLGRLRALTDEVSPRSLAVIKAQLWKSLTQSFDVSLEIADREMLKSFTSADFKEGVAHFVEKRAPRFTGR